MLFLLQVAVAQTSFSEKALGAAVQRLQGLEREIQMAGAYADALQDLLTACLSLRAATVGGKAAAVADAVALVVPGIVLSSDLLHLCGSCSILHL